MFAILSGKQLINLKKKMCSPLWIANIKIEIKKKEISMLVNSQQEHAVEKLCMFAKWNGEQGQLHQYFWIEDRHIIFLWEDKEIKNFF